jgi:hypothetical protein
MAQNASVGNSGVWSTSVSGVPSGTLKISTKYVRPERSGIQVGGVPYPGDVPSTKSYVQNLNLSSNHEYIDYIFNQPRPKKVSVGMFMYFSSEGAGWGDYDTGYDVFAITGSNGVNYLVFSLQTYTAPYSINIHTNPVPCNAGVELMRGQQDKWYWMSYLYDYNVSPPMATMEVYNVTDGWVKQGSGTCRLPDMSVETNKGLWRISVGLYDNHSGARPNSTYYMDDLMINKDGLWPFVPKPDATSSDSVAPSAPTSLRVAP